MAVFEDDYRELIETARDAVHDLLMESTPDSWLGLRRSYTSLRTKIELDDAERAVAEARDKRGEAKRRRDEDFGDQDERRDGWRRTPKERRESLLLHALGDDRLVMREITARMNVELTPKRARYRTLCETDVRGLVNRMFRGGQLDRVEDPFKNKVRYRYFRKSGLEGPIVNLERAYHDDDEEA